MTSTISDEMERYRKAKIWEGPGPATTPYGYNSYAAIAYSPTTHAYGYSWNYNSLLGAKRAALRACGTRDAQIVVFTRNNFIALAVGDGGASGANGRTAEEAMRNALDYSHKYTTNGHIVVCVFAGN